jgi:hypothetical protein
MRSFDQTSSPIFVLQPQSPPQPSYNIASNRPTFNSPFANSITASPHSSSWANLTPSPVSASAAGRKRSRDEAAPNLEEDVQHYTQTPAPPENEDEWEYGEGMTLIKPSGSGYIISAGSQTGTWAEEKVEEEIKSTTIPNPEMPAHRSAKSQRLDYTPSHSAGEQAQYAPVSPSAWPSNEHTEPTVDDFTRHLGIGWSLISADSDIQAAARGWSKFIDNHFPVTDAKIRLQSRGLASYLVEANEGYFLFSEDLKQGRLVSTSLEKTWENLRGPVPVFDGENVMEAGETPKTNGGLSPMVNGAHGQGMAMNGVDGAAANGGHSLGGQTLELEMDMS